MRLVDPWEAPSDEALEDMAMALPPLPCPLLNDAERDADDGAGGPSQDGRFMFRLTFHGSLDCVTSLQAIDAISMSKHHLRKDHRNLC